MTDLDKLIEVVDAGVDIFPTHFPHDFKGKQWAIRAYSGSLDSAKALHDALLPGWNATVNFGLGYASVSSPDHESRVTIWDGGSKWESVRGETYNAEVSDNPSRSWLLAILRAYEAQQ